MAISPVPSSLRQAFGQLMTSAIQSGNLFAAQSAYTTLSRERQQRSDVY